MNSLGQLLLNVAGITFLLAGATVAARIPRLTRLIRWRVLAAIIFVLCAALYVVLVDAPTRSWLGFSRGGIDMTRHAAWRPTIFTLALALAIVLFNALSWYLRNPADWLAPLLRGPRPLTVPATIAIVALIGWRVLLDHSSGKSIWPLVLSAAIFLYLWWLAIRLFDLVFLWHRYTRGAVLQKQLGKWRVEMERREETTREENQAAEVS